MESINFLESQTCTSTNRTLFIVTGILLLTLTVSLIELHEVDSFVNPDLEAIIKLSLQVSMNELNNVSSQFRTLNHQPSVEYCLTLFDSAVSKLNDSLVILAIGSEETALTRETMNDVERWISAAMIYEQTCLDGLEEMGSMVPDAMRDQLEKSNGLLTNSLALIANMHTLVHKFHFTFRCRKCIIDPIFF
ncbi:hypothetical protein M5689_005758 [Euphorbia peplus]|nr:hypothetical protein M5689_005758 [Euphorbia peplus]